MIKGEVVAMETTLSSTAKNVFVWFIVWFCCGGWKSEGGTTPNLKSIVIGRCYNYIMLINPTFSCDCEEVWRLFEEAVVPKSSCSNQVKDYQEMLSILPQNSPCHQFLFWSKTRWMMEAYTTLMENVYTLEDTLVGYVFNQLDWCGHLHHTGFDFESCPEWSTCPLHPVYSLWRQASQHFAETACGNITVLLNGSIASAFNRKSMFGSVELNGLNPSMVEYVNIKVVSDLRGPFIESCSLGSVAELIQILQFRGFKWTCTDNDLTLKLLQCVQSPQDPSCQMCSSSLLQTQGSPLIGP
ncbi:ADP-ribosyl cyclase/cyclic ADP-ribose hydrolase 1-like [Gadus macrocephalus]|uniref:ADP-ribosyl cyclase/cyclic ADP-ribose hydrolase 1-like n=1 Tax=Gadus macrocephalus TaxID=80720 RepID=UPI0028CBA365|nr:ADP-ribosyl cyclase/cyclic ADP-ribose hydrolase 1-like [Gadus macrocephalus]